MQLSDDYFPRTPAQSVRLTLSESTLVFTPHTLEARPTCTRVGPDGPFLPTLDLCTGRAILGAPATLDSHAKKHAAQKSLRQA